MSWRDDNITAMQGSRFGENTVGDVDIKLGEWARVSAFKPAGFVGVAADLGISAAAVDISLSGLSESGQRVIPAG